MAITAPAPAYIDSITQLADTFLSAENGTGGHRTIFAQALMDGIDEAGKADELKDYFILDIRKKSDYESAHIPGAINVEMGDIAKPSTLALLPRDKPILIVCYTGQSASLVNGILVMMGYDAWTLRFGMMSWYEASPVGIWSPLVQQEIRGGKLPVVSGKDPA